MSQCKAYKEKTGIEPDIFSGKIPVNCANCFRWNDERCSDENTALSSNDPELRESLAWCQF